MKLCEKTKIIEPINPNKSTGLFTGKSSGILNWNDLLYPEMHEVRTKIRDTFYNASDFKTKIPESIQQNQEELSKLQDVTAELLKHLQLSINLTSRLEGLVTDPSLVSIMATMSDQMYEHIRSIYRLELIKFESILVEHELLNSVLTPEKVLELIDSIIEGKLKINNLLDTLNNMISDDNEESKMVTHLKNDHDNHNNFLNKIRVVAVNEFSLKGMI